jgi:hypothetical protein
MNHCKRDRNDRVSSNAARGAAWATSRRAMAAARTALLEAYCGTGVDRASEDKGPPPHGTGPVDGPRGPPRRCTVEHQTLGAVGPNGVAAGWDFVRAPPPAVFSTNTQLLDSTRVVGAGDGNRTRDPKLGKLVLYQLSYSRGRRHHSALPRPVKANLDPSGPSPIRGGCRKPTKGHDAHPGDDTISVRVPGSPVGVAESAAVRAQRLGYRAAQAPSGVVSGPQHRCRQGRLPGRLAVPVLWAQHAARILRRCADFQVVAGQRAPATSRASFDPLTARPPTSRRREGDPPVCDAHSDAV